MKTVKSILGLTWAILAIVIVPVTYVGHPIADAVAGARWPRKDQRVRVSNGGDLEQVAERRVLEREPRDLVRRPRRQRLRLKARQIETPGRSRFQTKPEPAHAT